jgi:hypothetical protein
MVTSRRIGGGVGALRVLVLWLLPVGVFAQSGDWIREVLQGRPRSFAGRPIPMDADAVVQRDVDAYRQAGWTNMHARAYAAYSTRDPAWDEGVREILAAGAPRFTGGMTPALADTVLARCVEVADAGCEDLLFLLYRLYLMHEIRGATATQDLAEQAMAVAKNSPYPPSIKLLLAKECHTVMHADTLRDRIAAIQPWICTWLAEATGDPLLTDGYHRSYIWLLRNLYGRPDTAIKEFQARELLDVLERVTDGDPWLLGYAKALCRHDLGWTARGGGYSYTVSAEGWSVFGEELRKARELLEAVYPLHPEFPEVPHLLCRISRAAGSSEETRLWFDRAVRAQLDYTPAYDTYIFSLRPRWGGSHEEMIAFGRRCLGTERFDTWVPFQLMKVLQDISGEYREADGDPHEIYRREDLWADIETFFDGMMAEESWPEDTRGYVPCHYAAVCWAAGHWDRAAALLRTHGDRTNDLVLAAGRLHADPAAITSEIALYSGTWGRELADALKQFKDDRTLDAVPALLAAARMADDLPPAIRRGIEASIMDLPLDLDDPSSWEVVHLLLLHGRREALQFKLRDALAGGAESVEAEALLDYVGACLGAVAMRVLPLLPRRTYDTEAEYQAALRDVRAALDAAPRPATQEELDDRLLAECRVHVYNASTRGEWATVRAEYMESAHPLLIQCSLRGRVMDFVTETILSKRVGGWRRYLLLTTAGAHTQRDLPPDAARNRQRISPLEEILDKNELFRRAEAVFAQHASADLALRLAEMLYARGHDDDASMFEERALRYQDALMDPSTTGFYYPWSIASVCVRFQGYEDRILRAGAESFRRKHTDTAALFMADAHLRKGNASECMEWLVVADGLAADDYHLLTTRGEFRRSEDYRDTLIHALLNAPDLSADVRRQVLARWPSVAAASEVSATEANRP